jgi:excisionase family DNA binding protein
MPGTRPPVPDRITVGDLYQLPPALSLAQAAQVFQVSPRRVSDMVRAGTLHAIQAGERLRIPTSQVIEHLTGRPYQPCAHQPAEVRPRSGESLHRGFCYARPAFGSRSERPGGQVDGDRIRASYSACGSSPTAARRSSR